MVCAFAGDLRFSSLYRLLALSTWMALCFRALDSRMVRDWRMIRVSLFSRTAWARCSGQALAFLGIGDWQMGHRFPGTQMHLGEAYSLRVSSGSQLPR